MERRSAADEEVWRIRRAQEREANQGLRQSINFNYNWTDSAADNVNIFPQLGGKSSSNSNSLQAGYTVGYHKVTSIFNANWNRSTSQATNFFTNTTDIATQLGILGPGSTALNSSALNYGLPDVVLSNLTGLNEQQPNFSAAQTISLSETLSWIHGKHNLRFGGDYRRVHRDFLGGSNSTGTFYFTGAYTRLIAGGFSAGRAAGDQHRRGDGEELPARQRDGSVCAGRLARAADLTLNYGLRYEFYAPYTEKYGHLAFVDTNPGQGFTSAGRGAGRRRGKFSGNLPDSLVYPFRTAFAPRWGLRGAAAAQDRPCCAPATASTTRWASTPASPRPWRTSRRLPTSRPTKRPRYAARRRRIACR